MHVLRTLVHWMLAFGLSSAVVFLVVRRRVVGHVAPEFQDAASWGAFRIGTIHSLVFALTFSGLVQQTDELLNSIEGEALAIERLYRSLNDSDAKGAESLRRQIVRYTSLVISSEWSGLAKKRAG